MLVEWEGGEQRQGGIVPVDHMGGSIGLHVLVPAGNKACSSQNTEGV